MDTREIQARDVGPGPGLRRIGIRKSQSGGRFEASPQDYPMFEGVRFESVDFGGTRFGSFYATDSTFSDCSFRDVDFQGGHFSGNPQSVFRRCDFTGARLLDIAPGHARFEECTFGQVLIREWFAACAEFVACTFSGSIETTKFFGAPVGPCAKPLKRKVNEFARNDFREANLRYVEFVHGIDLDTQLLPDSGLYIRLNDLHERIRRARARLQDWDDAERQEALIVLEAISSGGMENQQDLFARRDDIPGIDPDLRDRIWALLEEG